MVLLWNKAGEQHSLDIVTSDESELTLSVMEVPTLTLSFSLPYYVDIPVGAYCTFEGKKYELLKPQTFAKNGNRKWDYTLIMEGAAGMLSRWKVRNPSDGSLEFPYTATPTQHIELLVDVLNAHKVEGGATWRVGNVIIAPEKLVNYNHTQISDALAEIATLFETEFEVTTEQEGGVYNTIHLGTVEHYKDNPIELAFGREGGFLPGLKRQNGDQQPVARLFIQGTEENIFAAKYKPLGGEVGSRRLLLPLSQEIGYDGTHFSDESGYNSQSGKVFVTSADGQSITLKGEESTIGNEDSLDCTDIVPAQTLTVEIVETEKHTNSEGEEYNEYNVVLNIPSDEDYNDYIVEGEIARVVFQSGLLAGREFDIHTNEKGKLAIEKVIYTGTYVGWRFKLVGTEQDGYFMPSATWAPKVGDAVRVFGIQLPNSAICNNQTRSGASWEMFREAVRVMWNRSVKSTYYEGSISTPWVSRNWQTVGPKVRPGGYVRLTDPAFEQEGALIRIQSVKYYVNNSHSPQITLSNEITTPGFRTTLEQLKGEEVRHNRNNKEVLDFTKRRFRDAKESQAMLGEALAGEFTESLSPIAVNTMQAIVGSTTLQYTFVSSLSDMTPASYLPTINGEVITCPEGYIKHETLGITAVKPERTFEEYMRWHIARAQFAFENADKAYYLYVRASKDNQEATMVLSDVAIALEAEAGFYHFLYATIGRLSDNARSLQAWNGFAEVTPGAIRAPRFVSNDGQQYFDFEKQEFRIGDDTKSIHYADGELEVSGAILGDSVLGQELRVLDQNEVAVAGLSGREDEPIIYGAVKTTVWHQWDWPNNNRKVYTTIGPDNIISGMSGIKLYETTDEGSVLTSTASYYGPGKIYTNGGILSSTGYSTTTHTAPRYQLLRSGMQIFGDQNGRRIQIESGIDTANIVVYDQEGKVRATINDETYNSIADIIPDNGSFEIYPLTAITNSFNTLAKYHNIEFEVKGAAKVRVPSFTLKQTFSGVTGYEGEITTEVGLWCYIDNLLVRKIEEEDLLNATGLGAQTQTTTAFDINVGAGKHTLTLQLRVLYKVPYGTWSGKLTANSNATISYEGHTSSIFANGWAFATASDEYFTAIENGGQLVIKGVVGGWGFEVDRSAFKLLLDGTWHQIVTTNDLYNPSKLLLQAVPLP